VCVHTLPRATYGRQALTTNSPYSSTFISALSFVGLLTEQHYNCPCWIFFFWEIANKIVFEP